MKEEFFSFPKTRQYPLHVATAEDNDFKEFLPAGRRKQDVSSKKPIQVLNDEGDDVEEVPRPNPADERRLMEVSGQMCCQTKTRRSPWRCATRLRTESEVHSRGNSTK